MKGIYLFWNEYAPSFREVRLSHWCEGALPGGNFFIEELPERYPPGDISIPPSIGPGYDRLPHRVGKDVRHLVCLTRRVRAFSSSANSPPRRSACAFHRREGNRVARPRRAHPLLSFCHATETAFKSPSQGDALEIINLYNYIIINL